MTRLFWTALAAALALAALLAALLWPGPVQSAERVDTAIVFIVDASGSMSREELGIARQSHAEAMVSAEVLDAIETGATGRIAVAYVEFAVFPTIRVPWTVIGGPGAAQAFAATVVDGPYPEASHIQTGLGRALLAADELLAGLPYVADRLVVDVVGDGQNSIGPEPALGRAAILSRGAVINTIALMRSPQAPGLEAYYADVVAGGAGHFSMSILGAEKMPMAIRSKIALELF